MESLLISLSVPVLVAFILRGLLGLTRLALDIALFYLRSSVDHEENHD